MTHTVSGPVQFVSARPHDQDTCSVTPTVVTCEFPTFDTDGSGREVTLIGRTTGIGTITHRATVSSNVPDPEPGNNSIEPEDNRVVALSTFALTPATVAGGQIAVAELALTERAPAGDALVRLTSSRPDVAAVPATFDIPSWTDHRNFHIVPAVVSAPTTVQISATYGLVTLTRTLIVRADQAQAAVPDAHDHHRRMRRVAGTGGPRRDGAPRGAVVPLSNSNSKATVPQNVTVPAGSDSVTFTVPTVPVITPAAGVVTASFGGVSQSLNVTVRPIRAQTLALSSTRVRGGTTVNGVVTLECPAVPGAIAVSFTSGNAAVAAATVPNITIPSGATTGSFNVPDQCRIERDDGDDLRLGVWRQKGSDLDGDPVARGADVTNGASSGPGTSRSPRRVVSPTSPRLPWPCRRLRR